MTTQQDQAMSDGLARLLSAQAELTQRLDSIESKLDELMRIQDLRAIASRVNVGLDPSLVSRPHYTMEFIDTVFELELSKNASAIEQAMRSVDHSFTAGERSAPSDPSPLMHGHYRTMLKRYVFAGKVFCSGKRVYDCCCGRGWGTHLLSTYAKHLYAVDRDERLIEQCRSSWPSRNITWKLGDVLDSDLFEERRFDVVTGMEIIEHFTRDDGAKLFDNIQRVLKPGGVFVATTYFPDTRRQADHHPTLKRSGHLFLWTKEEVKSELAKYFSTIDIIDSWMLVARKAVSPGED